jgi:hypothetical protein
MPFSARYPHCNSTFGRLILPDTKEGEVELARFLRLLRLQCGHPKPDLWGLRYANVPQCELDTDS